MTEEAQDFEQYDQLYADWQSSAMLLDAAQKIIQDIDVDNEEDFKILLGAIHFSLMNLVRMWENDTPVMVNIEMFKRFAEIEAAVKAEADTLVED